MTLALERDLNEIRLANESIDSALKDYDSITRLHSKICSDYTPSELECKLAHESVLQIARSFQVNKLPTYAGPALSTEKIATKEVRLSIENVITSALKAIVDFIVRAISWIVEKFKSIFQKKIPEAAKAAEEEIKSTVKMADAAKPNTSVQTVEITAGSAPVFLWADTLGIDITKPEFMKLIETTQADTPIVIELLWNMIDLQFITLMESIGRVHDMLQDKRTTVNEVRDELNGLYEQIYKSWEDAPKAPFKKVNKPPLGIANADAVINNYEHFYETSPMLNGTSTVIGIRKFLSTSERANGVNSPGAVFAPMLSDTSKGRDKDYTQEFSHPDLLAFAQELTSILNRDVGVLEKNINQIKRQSDKDSKKLEQLKRMSNNFLKLITDKSEQSEILRHTLEYTKESIKDYQSVLSVVMNRYMTHIKIQKHLNSLSKDILAKFK